MKPEQILGGIIIGGAIAVYSIYYFNQQKHGELLRLINNGASIMGLQPHCDDCEVFSPGPFLIAKQYGNPCWIFSVVPPEQCCGGDPIIQGYREEANQTFKEHYLQDYFYGEGHPLRYDRIKTNMINIIEEKKPDILLTFTPYGWWDNPGHIMINNIVSDLHDELSYTPKIFWFINTDQGPFPDGLGKEHPEDEMYPPKQHLKLDVYSDVLGKTFWEAKIEVWEWYSRSIPGIGLLLENEELMAQNDRKEYFRRHK